MPIFRRKSAWQRLLEGLTSGSKLALKAGATAAAGAAALTAASAAVSSYRQQGRARAL